MALLEQAYESIKCVLESMLREDEFELVIYGSAGNCLFEQPQQNGSGLSSDLDLTLISTSEPPYEDNQLGVLKKAGRLLLKAWKKKQMNLANGVRAFMMSAGALLQF